MVCLHEANNNIGMLLIPHILGEIKIKYIYTVSSTATIYINLLSTTKASHPYLKTLMVNSLTPSITAPSTPDFPQKKYNTYSD